MIKILDKEGLLQENARLTRKLNDTKRYLRDICKVQAWVVEAGDSPAHSPLYLCGLKIYREGNPLTASLRSEWSPDHMKATRFKRASDACNFAVNENDRVCFHEWS